MKMKYLPLLFIVLATAMESCKKEQQPLISGKWKETKMVLYKDSGNVVLWDTTYLTPFTSFDYMQFNYNGTCVMGSDFYLMAATGGPGFAKTVQRVTPMTSNWNYSAIGPAYVLAPVPNLVNFAGLITGDTVSIKGNTLLLHAVDHGPGPAVTLVFDCYFTKE
jgi:hypothetical protein